LLQDQLRTIGLSGQALEKAKSDVLRNLPESYISDLKSYNPTEAAQRLSIPMLILQGERDYQVTMKDFDLWKAALAGHGNVMFRSYAALNHLFQAGEGKSTPVEYAQAGHVDVEVIEQIAGWIKRVR
jgi:uncharacterized protein